MENKKKTEVVFDKEVTISISDILEKLHDELSDEEMEDFVKELTEGFEAVEENLYAHYRLLFIKEERLSKK